MVGVFDDTNAYQKVSVSALDVHGEKENKGTNIKKYKKNK